jgi:hypothetical protein
LTRIANQDSETRSQDERGKKCPKEEEEEEEEEEETSIYCAVNMKRQCRCQWHHIGTQAS